MNWQLRDHSDAKPEELPGLLERLAEVPHPRDPRGVRQASLHPRVVVVELRGPMEEVITVQAWIAGRALCSDTTILGVFGEKVSCRGIGVHRFGGRSSHASGSRPTVRVFRNGRAKKRRQGRLGSSASLAKNHPTPRPSASASVMRMGTWPPGPRRPRGARSVTTSET
jgi:hypothetical protein